MISGTVKIGIGAAVGYALARVIEGTSVGLSIMDVLRPDSLFKSVISIRRNLGNATEAARYGVTMPVNPEYLPPQ